MTYGPPQRKDSDWVKAKELANLVKKLQHQPIEMTWPGIYAKIDSR